MLVPDNPKNDPFTRCYDAIQNALTGFAPLAALVKPGNFINQRIVQPNPRKEDAEDSDWPELSLALVSFTDEDRQNSRATRFSADYALQIASGALTVEVLCKLWWESRRALFVYDPSLKLGLPFVERYTARGRSPALLTERGPAALNVVVARGTEQWCNLLTITVIGMMDVRDVQNYPPQVLGT